MAKYKVTVKIIEITKYLETPLSKIKEETFEVTQKQMFKLLGLVDFLKEKK